MRNRALFTLTVVLCPLVIPPHQVVAQQAPEAQRLGWFVGEWVYEDLDGGAECEWLGELIVDCHSSWINSAGDSLQLRSLIRYDRDAQVYTAYRFYSGGYADSGLGWVDGDTWKFVHEGPEGARYRATVLASQDTWAYEWHRSVRGGPWEPRSTGALKRVR